MTEWIIALVTLTFLEIVLGVDNVIFVSILSSKLKKDDQKRARRVGLGAAMLMRIGLLFSITWIARLTTPFFNFAGHDVTGRAPSTHSRRPSRSSTSTPGSLPPASTRRTIIAPPSVAPWTSKSDSVRASSGIVRICALKSHRAAGAKAS
mgnify:CR=1 FL=1